MVHTKVIQGTWIDKQFLTGKFIISKGRTHEPYSLTAQMSSVTNLTYNFDRAMQCNAVYLKG
jgi:hypothetical protein